MLAGFVDLSAPVTTSLRDIAAPKKTAAQ